MKKVNVYMYKIDGVPHLTTKIRKGVSGNVTMGMVKVGYRWVSE